MDINASGLRPTVAGATTAGNSAGGGSNNLLAMEGGASPGPSMAAAASGRASGGVRRNSARAYARSLKAPNLKTTSAALFGGGLLTMLIVQSLAHVTLVITMCLFGAVFAYWLSVTILQSDDGTAEMRQISDPIRSGSEGFLKVQYGAILKLALPTALIIFLSYFLRPASAESTGVEKLGGFTLGLLAAITFIVGAGCSGICGYVTMIVSARSNIRVASAARRSYSEALILCFQGGAFSAILAIVMCVGGITVLYCLSYLMFGGSVPLEKIPLLLTGYGFGASFVAMFMQLGGGIYTKAADVGADLVGKVEQNMPEDDPRNPAVIADLVGDMVGDCVGSSADVFESVSAEIVGAMILAGTLASEIGLQSPAKFIFFPVVVHAFNIFVSIIGIMSMTRYSRAAGNTPANPDPMAPMKHGFLVASILAVLLFGITTRWLLYVPSVPGAWWNFFCCGVMGMLCSYAFVLSSQYYTDYMYSPVRSIAKASCSGHGVNIIVGVSVGMKSTVIPTIAISITVVASYLLGVSSGVGSGRNAGLFGTAVATMGMLSTAGYILSMNNYGPIADNAGGIAEMSHQHASVRDTTDRLDAAGNVTKAMTKGYSIGSAALACFLLFGAFMDEFSEYAGIPFRSVDVANPEVLIGGLIGVMMIFLFAGLAIAAVGKTAEMVVVEVRRQLSEHPEIMDFKVLPDYQRCVAIVTEAALGEMRVPGVLAVVMPVTTGLIFRYIGDATGRPLLGAEVLASYLMFATVTGILMALFLDNVGGAWDNAKKYVELGNFGGKGSEAHKAAVTGDTVGDPFKDTAGPALHVVIKLLSTTILVLAPLFVSTVSE